MLERRKRNNEKRRIQRMKKKENLISGSRSALFSTPQVKGKLLKRTRETLTGDPEQNRSILTTLMNEFVPQEQCQERQKSGPNLPSETLEKVKQFYYNDEISRPSPGSKDFVTVFENGKKKQLSVRHLLYSLKECHGMFRADNPDHEISRSKFTKLRPPDVLSFSLIQQNVCVCQIHENLRCALKSLKASSDIFADLIVDNAMHKNFVCEDSKDIRLCSLAENVKTDKL